MSRSVSNTFKSTAFGSQTDEAYLVLLTIDHEDLDDPLYVTSNGIAVISGGNTFLPYPFTLTLPDDTERPFSRGRLTIDAVSQTWLAIRWFNTPVSITIQVVLASDPDTVEVEFPDFELTELSYNEQTISGSLSIESFTEEPFPGDAFIPSFFPGLF